MVVAAVVKPGGASALVVRHLLRDLQLPAIAQVFGNAGGAEGVAAGIDDRRARASCSASCRRAPITSNGQISDYDPLHLIETDQVIAPVVEARRACALVGGHSLSNLELAAVLQVLGYASRSEGMIAYPRPDPGCAGSPGDHPVGVRLAHRFGGESAATPSSGAE